jgi:peptidoglycan/xylan/chitin deacetylase (PgdA/CDA1 family)
VLLRKFFLTGVALAAFLATAPTALAGAPTVVSLTFDDGIADQAAVVPMLDAHGMKGTFFINAGRVGTPGYLTWGQLATTAADGNEISGHTLDHVDLTTVSSSEATYQVCENRARLLNHGFADTDFAYPFGAGWHDSTIRSIVQACGYNSARGAWGLVGPVCTTCTAWAETIPPADIWAVRTTDNAQATTTLATLQGYVTNAETHGGGWVILVFHHICDGCNTYSTSPATLQSLLDWLQPRAASGTTVRTMNQVIGGSVRASPGTADTTAPTSSISCDGSLCSSGSYSSAVQVALSASDTGGSGLEAIRYTTDGSTPTLTSPVYGDSFTVSTTSTIKFRAWDNAGNVDATHSQLIQIGGADTTPPTSSIFCDGTTCSTSAYAAPVQVTLTATDDSSGVATIRYTTDGSDPTLSSAVYSAPLTIATTTTVNYRAWDNAGNLEATNSQLIQIATGDSTAPTSSISCNGGVCSSGWYNASVQGTLSATDTGGSGVAAIRYTLDGSTPTTASAAYAGPFALSATTTVKYRAWDNAGNVEATHSQLIQIDTVAPTVALTSPANGASITGTVQVQATAADTGSGVAQVRFYLDGTVVSTTTNAPYKYAWNTRKASKGQHTLTAVAVDKAGNSTTSSAVVVTVT